MAYAWWTVILALLVGLVHAVATAVERLRNDPLPVDTDALRLPCGAKPRPQHHEKHWECTGQGLVVLTRVRLDGKQQLPVVAPRWALPIVLSQPWGSTYDEPTTFPGGDHIHLTLPESARPPVSDR